MIKVKVCGITNLEDAKAALAAGAWSLGFNFYPKSPRYITPNKAADIINQLPRQLLTVGVFVNETTDSMRTTQRISGVKISQLHGNEDPEVYAKLSGPIIKALKLSTENDLTQIDSWFGRCIFLVDSYSKTMLGGTGQVANWALAQKMALQAPTILAGGLNAENLQQAISTVEPLALDICSGVEEAPGKKSKAKLFTFFDSLKRITKGGYVS